MPSDSMTPFFTPHRIAVIGVSHHPLKAGYELASIGINPPHVLPESWPAFAADGRAYLQGEVRYAR